MKMLVTGAAGFIGSHLVNYLKDKGHWVRAVDIRPASESYLQLKADEIIQADLRDFETCLHVTKDIDWVFNLAANMGGIGYITKVRAEVMRDNISINVNVAEACRQNGVDRLFFSSSACVYPEYKQNTPSVPPLKEEDAIPADPDTYYGWEKLFTEKLLEAYKLDYSFNVRIARFHNIYGPYTTFSGGREKAPAALCRKVAEAKDGETIVIWGDGKQSRSFLYIDDCLEAIYLLMKSNYSEPLNIGSDELITIDELADIIIEISGKKLHKEYDLTKPQGVRGRNADLTKIRKILNWKPKTPYKDGLTKTYKWIEKMVQEEKARNQNPVDSFRR